MIRDATTDLVRMQRIDDLQALICRVYMSTNECVIASELSGSLDLDGLCVVPTKLIRCFDRAFEKAEFYKAALQAWPDIELYAALLGEFSCSLIQDLSHLAGRGDIVAVHMELVEPDVCYVGSIRSVTETELILNRISSRGQWLSEPFSVPVDSITKIEIATRYLTAVGYAARTLAAAR